MVYDEFSGFLILFVRVVVLSFGFDCALIEFCATKRYDSLLITGLKSPLAGGECHRRGNNQRK